LPNPPVTPYNCNDLTGWWMMSQFSARLYQLERRLQILIEGSATRLLSHRAGQNGLAERLVSAMHAGIQPGRQGGSTAPNLFTLFINPGDAPIFQENLALLDDLAGAIQQAGREAGLLFLSPPFIKLSPDPDVPAGNIRVQAQLAGAQPGDTGTMVFEPEREAPAFPANAFLIVNGNQVFPLAQPVINIGRRMDNDLIVEDERVSRLHAQLRVVKGRYTIFDLDSTGGTFLNGKRIQQGVLRPGDVISLAGFSLVFGQETALWDQNPGSTHPLPKPPSIR
jgi:hypothetical protein